MPYSTSRPAAPGAPSLSALLTDLDGTLVDSLEAIISALNLAFRAVAQDPPPRQAILDMFGLPVELMLTRLTPVDPGDTETVSAFIAAYKRHYPDFLQESRVLPGVHETLAALRDQGFPVALITSERRQNVGRVLEHLNLAGYFTAIITRDDVRQFKPAPEPVLKAAYAVGMDPKDCAYIGESPFDMTAGKAAGVFCIAVPSGPWSLDSLVETEPDAVVHTFAETMSYLQVHNPGEGVRR